VERWRRSGLTRREFAAREGCSAAQLAWWKWRLKRKDEAMRPDARATRESSSAAPASRQGLRSIESKIGSAIVPTLVPVTLAPPRRWSASLHAVDSVGAIPRGSTSGYGAMRVVLPSGTEVRVEADVDEQALTRVLRALAPLERGC